MSAPRYNDLLGCSLHSGCSHTLYTQVQFIRANQQRETRKPRGNQMQTSESAFPVGPHGTCLITPATICNDTYEMLSISEIQWTISTQEHKWELVR
jgi:hypothetical protein